MPYFNFKTMHDVTLMSLTSLTTSVSNVKEGKGNGFI